MSFAPVKRKELQMEMLNSPVFMGALLVFILLLSMIWLPVDLEPEDDDLDADD